MNKHISNNIFNVLTIMKRNKIFSILMMLVIVLGAAVILSSCSNNEPYDEGSDYMYPDSDYEGGSSDPTYNIVKNNISATVSYSDYSWNISIKSKLANAFPNKDIIYGVESGYGYYQYYEHFKFNNDNQKTDWNGNITVCYPVFVGNEYATESLFWDSYRSLKNKKAIGKLTDDENELYNSCVRYMNEKENKAKSTFCGRLYAQMNNDRYFFYTFGKEPTSPSGTGGGSDDDSSGTGSSTSYEKPDIGFSDYTPYTTKLKVVYEIYNKSNAQVSSAKIYYGTSSNPTKSVSATVSSSLISATISGLQKGTTYYVKCVATGKGGTTTTGTTRVMTEY